MPSTAVASRMRKWDKIKHKYKVHTREYYAKKLAKLLATKKAMENRRASRKR